MTLSKDIYISSKFGLEEKHKKNDDIEFKRLIKLNYKKNRLYKTMAQKTWEFKKHLMLNRRCFKIKQLLFRDKKTLKQLYNEIEKELLARGAFCRVKNGRLFVKSYSTFRKYMSENCKSVRPWGADLNDRHDLIIFVSEYLNPVDIEIDHIKERHKYDSDIDVLDSFLNKPENHYRRKKAKKILDKYENLLV